MSRHNPKKLSEDAIRRHSRNIINLYRERGLGTVAIANIYDTFPQEISSLLRRKQVQIRPAHPPVKRLEAQRLRDIVTDYAQNGLSLAELEEKYGVGKYSIRRYLKHLGVPLRRRGQRESSTDLRLGAEIDTFLSEGYPVSEVAEAYTGGDVEKMNRVHTVYLNHISLLQSPGRYDGSAFTHRIDPYSVTLEELFQEVQNVPKSKPRTEQKSKPKSKKRYNIRLNLDKLREMAELGYSVPTLAAQFNVSEPTIKSRLQDIGAPVYTTTKGEDVRIAHTRYTREYTSMQGERVRQREKDIQTAERLGSEIKARYLISNLLNGKDIESTAEYFNLPKSVVEKQLYSELRDVISVMLTLYNEYSVDSVLEISPDFLDRKKAAYENYSDEQIQNIYRDFVKDQLPFTRRGEQRSNPYSETSQNVLGAGIGLGGTFALERILNARTEMSKTQRAVTSGGIGVLAGFATYAVTDKECALWGAAGSFVGALLTSKLYSI